jgi:hypothetical protein
MVKDGILFTASLTKSRSAIGAGDEYETVDTGRGAANQAEPKE